MSAAAGVPAPDTSDVAGSGVRVRPDGAGVVAGGLLALTAATFALMVVIGEVIPPAAVLAVLFAATAIGVLRAQRPAVRWAAVVLPLVLVVANLPFAVADLQHPESAGGFVPTLAIVVLALATAGLALRHARGRPVPGRAVWGGVAVVLVAGTAVSVVATTGLSDDTAAPGDTTVEIADLTYPDRLAVAAGDGVLLDNAAPYRHTFVVEGTDVAVEVPASTARRVPLDLPAGEYRYLCDVPGHESMEGVLVVE